MALQNLRSNTANKRPTAAGMSDGQIALNTNATEPGLFFKDAGGTIRKVGPIAVGSSAPNSSPATGGSTGNSIGEAWLDTSTTPAILKIWDGTTWASSSSLPLAGGTLTGQLLLDDAGSAAAPDVAFDGDTNTGIFSPADDNVAISTAGTQRLVVDPSGNVGIGVTSPSSALDVSGTIKSTTVDATTVDGDTITVNTKIELPNKEKTTLGTDGELSFDSSQGLIVYRTQQGVTSAAVTVLDGANVAAGSNINITNLGAGDTGTGQITFSVDSTNLDADTVDGLEASQFLRSDASDSTTGTITAPSFAVTNGGTITDATGNYGSVKVTGGATGGYSGYAINDSAVFMDSGTIFGLYDDTNNHWVLKHTKNGATELYYDGSKKLATTSAGGALTGTWTGTIANATNATNATSADNADTVDNLHASSFLRSDATDTYDNGQLNIQSNSASGHYWGVGIEYNSGWKHTNANSWGFAFRNSGGYLDIYSSQEAGTSGGTATYRVLSIGGSSSNLQYDGNTVWHAGNDGPGSGLNADTVDNLHASSFLRADANDTATGTVTFNGVVNIRSALDLADNDILRFGSGDDCELFCNGSHMYMDLNSGIGNFYIRDGTTTRFTFDDAGHFTATGTISSGGQCDADHFESVNGDYDSGDLAGRIRLRPGTIGSRTTILTLNPNTSAGSVALVQGGSGLVDLLGVYNNTNASAANVRVTSQGYVRRSTSALRYKRDIEEVQDTYADNFLENARPVWFRSVTDRADMTLEEHETNWSHWGFIAEELDQVEPRLVDYSINEEGNPVPEGVQYDRVPVLLTNIVKRQRDTITQMQTQITSLQASVSALEARLAALESGG